MTRHRPRNWFRRPRPWTQTDPRLDEALFDPTIRRLMEREGARLEDLTEVIGLVRKRLIVERWRGMR